MGCIVDLFLADDIFVPEGRGVSRLAPYEHKNYSQTQLSLFREMEF
jgi:hypothetical protein